jgi:hypothetical protein
MITAGCTALHQNSRVSYGLCDVLTVNASGTSEVHWHTHRVKRTTKRPGRNPLTESESHVDTRCLTRVHRSSGTRARPTP